MPKNVTISVSDELARKMNKYPDVNWSEVGRQAFGEYIKFREPQEKGEIIENLEKYLKSTVPIERPEAREALRDAEKKRFARKWGKPDSAYPDDSPGTELPYINIEKRVEIKHNGIQANLRVFNGVRTYWTEYSPLEYNPENWGKVRHIADYFKTSGFNIVVIHFDQTAIRHFLTGGNKEQARQLRRSKYDYYGLFAFDKEDTVFIDHQKKVIQA